MDRPALGATGFADERLVAGNRDRAAEELLERDARIVAARGRGNGAAGQRQQKQCAEQTRFMGTTSGGGNESRKANTRPAEICQSQVRVRY